MKIKFLIQTFNGRVEHDFVHTLIQSKEYHDWSTSGWIIELYYSDLPQITGDYVPVGSVEFVHGFMEMNGIIPPDPINIPNELMDYSIALRRVFNGTDMMVHEKMFVKSNETVKSYNEITDNPPPGKYQISEVIPIESEWRCFIYNSELVGLKHYSGDFRVFPDMVRVDKMIGLFKNKPIACTLDVGISDGKTVPIEAHHFYSCGLYGFNDYRLLPAMFVRWWKWYTEK